jgi:broad specificity phosphatase PhoE
VTRVLLVRHGESTWNAEGRWQGQADPPLSERGEAQAVTAARALVGLEPFDAIVSSTLRRARRTAEILAGALSVQLLTHPDLIERAAGPWEGLTRADIDATWPGWLAEGRRPDGYETDDAIRVRATMALTDLCRDRAGDRILVVAHGGVIASLERHHDDPSRPPTLLGNLEGRWFEHQVGRPGHELRATGARVALLGPATGDEVLTPEPAAIE